MSREEPSSILCLQGHSSDPPFPGPRPRNLPQGLQPRPTVASLSGIPNSNRPPTPNPSSSPSSPLANTQFWYLPPQRPTDSKMQTLLPSGVPVSKERSRD